MSDEDLSLLHPTESAVEVARRWVRSGPAAVVVTRGPDGAIGLTAGGDEVDVAGEVVEVIDTVGAGDAFTAGLLDALARGNTLERTALRDISAAELGPAIGFAVQVAARTCGRAGADPPRRDELDPR